MLGVVFGAVVLFLIIFTMEGELPEWLPIIGCVLATIIPTAIVGQLVPFQLFFVGPLVGALVGGCVISALHGMALKRSCIAAGLYLLFQIGFEVVVFSIRT